MPRLTMSDLPNAHPMRFDKTHPLFSGASATAHSPIIPVDPAKSKQVNISTDGVGAGESLNSKVKMSNQESAPDFTAARSETNQWYYANSKQAETTGDVPGATGVTISGADGHENLIVNNDGGRWFCLEATVVGTFTFTANLALSDQ